MPCQRHVAINSIHLDARREIDDVRAFWPSSTRSISRESNELYLTQPAVTVAAASRGGVGSRCSIVASVLSR